MSISDRFAELAYLRDALGAEEADPTRIVMDRILSPTEAMIGNRPTILVGTNNYLGLTFDPAVLEAASAALHEQGSGTTGSRMANGSFACHAALERSFAEFYGVPSAMVFSTGYQTNLGLLMGILRPGDKVVLDSHSHACIYDGCRISGADFLAFRHNDPEDLRKRLRRLGEEAKGALVIAECRRQEYGAWFMVDEAHSFGVYGERGLGLCEEAGILDQVDFITGTFSKSLASLGGFCVSRHPELQLLRYGSRPYIFTASPSPASIGAAAAALGLCKAASRRSSALPWRQSRWGNT